MRIIAVKLISGEELVAKVYEDDTSEYFNLVDPVRVSTGYDQDGNYGIKVHDFMLHCENQLFTISAKCIMIHTTPSKEMVEYYLQYLNSLDPHQIHVSNSSVRH